MSDASMRAAEREANTVEERAALLLTRWRAGEWVERDVNGIPGRELAAYVGDDRARYLLAQDPRFGGVWHPGIDVEVWDEDESSNGHCAGCGWWAVHKHDCPRIDIGRWVRGLERYGEGVLRRAERALDCLLFGNAADPGYEWADGVHDYAARVASLRSEPAVRRAIREALVPWALGEVE